MMRNSVYLQRKGTAMLSGQTFVKLNNGVEMPQLGSSIDLEPDSSDNAPVMEELLKCGYAHIDTSHAYDDISIVRDSLEASGIDRDDLWITGMLWPGEYRRGTTVQEIDKALRALGTDHIDLLLQHQQFSNYVDTWHDMEAALEQGKVRAIGLSGFEGVQLERLLAQANVAPAVLQIECHPLCQQGKIKAQIESFGTVIMAKYPLAHGQEELFENETIARIASELGKSVAQVILRWHLQEGHLVMPKSSNPEHIAQNAQIFDFELTQAQMEQMRGLEADMRLLLPMHRSLATPVVHHQVFRSAGSRTMAPELEVNVSLGYGKIPVG